MDCGGQLNGVRELHAMSEPEASGEHGDVGIQGT
jgi:hypothetical protein